MEIIRLSSKGQIVIPKSLRNTHNWHPGQEFILMEVGEGLLLKAKQLFPPTTLDEVAGCLNYTGPAKSIEEMNEAIRIGVEQSYGNF
jgi:AbrB family looped-hinge helix DNA binding protein